LKGGGKLRIVDLQIYGYGQLENVSIHNLNDFQVFFGENEAGKSTLMAFIHGILFGFPTKQQSTDLRYEPKNSTKYGGKITILHDKYGQVVIERIKGKSAGDVTAALENGTVGGEELLKEILYFFDKNVYQAIFSFNLHGLQNIHQLKGEELGRFLFSAGTLGSDRLAQTESVLQKEMDSRFKPGGRKPVLNEKLHVLHEINGELKKASAKNKEFEVLVETKEGLQRELPEIDDKLKKIGRDEESLKEWKKIHLLVKEEQFLNTEILELGDVHFPIHGINRLDQLKQVLHPCNAQISSLSQRITLLEEELASLNPDLQILENEEAIQALIEQIPLYEQWMLEKKQCELQIKEYETKLAAIKEKLHLSLQDEEIIKLNTNIYMKDRVEKLSRKSLKLQEVKEELEVRFQEEKNSLEKLESDVKKADGQVLSVAERRDLEEQLFNGNSKKQLEIEWESVKDKIELFQQANEQEKKNYKQKQQQFFIFELLLIGILLYGTITRGWFLIILGVFGSIVIGIYMLKGAPSKGKGKMDTLERLKEQEKQLFQKLQSSEIRNITAVENQIQLDDRNREHLQLLKVKLEQQQIQYEKVISQFEAWELESSQHKDKLVSIGKDLKIPYEIAASHLLDAFQLLEEHKSIVREKKQLIDRLEQITLKQKKVEQGVGDFSNSFLTERITNLHQTAFLLRNKLKEEEEKQIKSREKQLKLSELTADLRQKKLEQQHLQLEIHKLLKEADVNSEEEFYELGNKAEKYGKQIERLEDIKKQLQFSLLSKSDRERFLENDHFEENLLELVDQIQLLQERKTLVQEQLASIKYELQVLEEGGVYTDLLHQYKQKKYEFEEAAKEWAVFTVAHDILNRTIDRYKNTHLPKMLLKAEEYLLFLSDGNYHKIHLRESGTGFLIERKDHTMFEANELSQATAEQVYVSIRFALATTLYEKYHLPIIIDDSFVNFDEKRTRKVIELLMKLKGNQILFFTCHAHLLQFFKKENILCLEKGALKILS
jgi:uncharacterized protein YhaN